LETFILNGFFILQKFQTIDHSQDELLNFCRLEHFTYVYEILQSMPRNFIYTYYDSRRQDWPNIFEIFMKLSRRSVGVILQHKIKDNLICDIYGRKSLREGYRKHSERPVYPSIEVPPLIELLDRSAYPQHDEVRMQLTKWTISDKLMDMDLSEVTPGYFCSALTLFFMVEQGFITVREADIILLSVKHVMLDTIPERLERPPIVDGRAFRVSFLFGQLFKLMGRSVKQCGLMHLYSYFIYDGVLFHNLFLEFEVSQADPAAQLTEIDQNRIYRNVVLIKAVN
jgi:hypothetical protein